MKKNFEEVIELINKVFEETPEEVQEDWQGVCDFFEDNTGAFKEVLGEIKNVEFYGGEDKGSNYYHVYFLPDHDMYIKLQGWYQSYNGVEYEGLEDFSEVKPVEKTITVYE